MIQSSLLGHVDNRWHFLSCLAASLTITVITLFITPGQAEAVQIHGAPEGLYVHNMAHVFFSAALVFLLYILHKYPVGHGPAWRYLKLSFLLFLIWNIDTFTVHILSVRLPADAIVKNPDIWKNYLRAPLTLERWIYYFGTFDHILCVPAIIFLVLSLKHFCKETKQKIDSSKRAET